MFKRQKGFTLIELLVVIAIIGLLAGIVLVSLGGARDSAKDARIKGDVAQVKTFAELIANANNGAYTTLCETTTNTLDETVAIYGTDIGTLETDMTTTQGGTAWSCYASADAYCFEITLNNGNELCIDQRGQTVEAGSTACASGPTTCN